MTYVTVSKDIDVDLGEFETQDLLEELSRRKSDASIPLGGTIAFLKREKAPNSLIEMLTEWDRLPVANAARLEAWKMWATQ